MKRKKMLIIISLPIILVLFIFALSSMDGGSSHFLSRRFTKLVIGFGGIEIDDIDFELIHYYARKMAHIGMYFLLYIIIQVALMFTDMRNRFKIHFALIVCIMVSLIDEINQSLVSGRNAQVQDVFFDLAGTLFGVIAFVYFSKWYISKRT